MGGPLRAGFALLFVFCASESADAFTVAIDPGHGGAKYGALSPVGLKEKDISLAVAQKLKGLLEENRDVKVILTRDSDTHVELQDRTKVANQAKADVLVSIHCNSMATPEARRNTTGLETYFLSADASDANAQAVAELENADVSEATEAAADPISMILHDLSRTVAHADSKRLAEDVHGSLVRQVGMKDHGVHQAPFIVLLGAEMPAVLVEIGFISHPVEGRKLATPAYQLKVATALRDAVLHFRDTVFAKRTAPEPAPVVVPAAPTHSP
jgi:N-acetylmuramoyl-L-alanine amidase